MSDKITEEEFEDTLIKLQHYNEPNWKRDLWADSIRTYVSQLKASIKENEREAARKMVPIVLKEARASKVSPEARKMFTIECMKAWEEE